jgi:hypothetical protein
MGCIKSWIFFSNDLVSMFTGHVELRLPEPHRLASIILHGLCETLVQHGGIPLAAHISSSTSRRSFCHAITLSWSESLSTKPYGGIGGDRPA